MIDREKLTSLIKSHIPNASDNIITEVACDITQDVESIIYSMVRQATSQVKEQLYTKNSM